jgi:hypothetical protein
LPLQCGSTRDHRLLHQRVDSHPPSDLKNFYGRWS